MLSQPIDYFLLAWFILAVSFDGVRRMGSAAPRHQRAMYLKQAARGEESRVYGDYPTVRETLRYPTGREASERRAPSSGPMTCSPHH